MKVLGLDGCKGGWVGIVTDPDFAAPRVVGGGDLAVLIAASGAAHAVIDIPLGLSETGPRACDAAARGVLIVGLPGPDPQHRRGRGLCLGLPDQLARHRQGVLDPGMGHRAEDQGGQ